MELYLGLFEEVDASGVRSVPLMDNFLSTGLSSEDVALIRASFDAEYYRETYPDIAANNLDPLEHFCLFGWKENRDPTPWFSVRSYLLFNPDVTEAGENPFLHYLRFGQLEQRQIAPVDGNNAGDISPIEGLSLEDVALIRASFDAGVG